MTTNAEIDQRRNESVARALAYSSTFVAERAKGVEVWDVEGNRYIDFGGGIGCQNVGHGHPRVISAIEEQTRAFTHTCFQISPYEKYVLLAERLNVLAPGDFRKKSLFFSAGGEAVENAVKIARFYTQRPGLITFTNGYHGRSYMGMGLSARMNPFKVGFRPFPTEIYRIPFPDKYHKITLDDTKRAFATLFSSEIEPTQVAAAFFEPVQGEGGYNVAEPSFLEYLRELCDEHGIVMVADEIQSGFGRTGKMFAMDHYGVAPDLTCIGKSMGGGLPLSGIVGRATIIDSVPPGGLGGTFGGNPVACAAALAVLDVIDEENLLAKGLRLGTRIDTLFREMADRTPWPCIGDIRSLGCMNAIELVRNFETHEPAGELTANIVKIALSKGLILVTAGPERNVIRILVPLSVSTEVIEEGMSILEASINEAFSQSS
ncbi:MAG: 4-aminobutyrate--2-oxoglutarate transaminase [SAR324 cluster bacterium]|jgi:4-aminobutyrate aminotransferase|nr:4-aminobutyrate--2-oxoglutarate transaminase [SAR324 cluster bacterium]